eukprot:TRINITY_DN61080_c0_g1_i1.p1 TRINITY_DN61080_c0_g1~~TRINITY_DN61080_c0_g1_i1.p1  ORF type:complete len:454 (-),score=68.93 TRINITY_DN61080_c0_g1_i1:41-1378(-)
MLAEFSLPSLCSWCERPNRSSPLLALAKDLGDRIYPAFSASPSGIPFAWVNLRHGMRENETSETNLAGSGTGLLEYAMLSRLLGDDKYEAVIMTCLSRLWDMRSEHGLFGTSINAHDGTWNDNHASIGFGTDSFFEYLLKGYILLGDPWFWGMFAAAYEGTQRFMRSGPWYADVNRLTGEKIQEVFTSLQAFFPGTQVDIGDLGKADETLRAIFGIWQKFGLMPERYLYKTSQVHPSMKYYPLRPELAESILWLSQATGDPYYQQVVGRTMVEGLNNYSRVETGGFATIRDVETMEKENHQQSFFLSETLKYLYLLFNDTFLRGSDHAYVFTTEGHPLPVVEEIRRNSSGNELPQRLRGWCFGFEAEGLLGKLCSPLDLRICPNWQTTAEATVGKLNLEPVVVASACHVLDKDDGSRCTKPTECGVDAGSCRERLCSSHGFCYTP